MMVDNIAFGFQTLCIGIALIPNWIETGCANNGWWHIFQTLSLERIGLRRINITTIRKHCRIKQFGDLDARVLGNIYFDTCVYHQRGIDLLLDVIPTKNILFASEMIGAVRGIDPRTDHHYDDTKRYIDANIALNAAAKAAIFEGNARRVFSRLKI